MQLKIARLCLDCDEVHISSHCPVCASEAFAYLTRWVPAPERRMRPRQVTSPEADLYRQLNLTHQSPPTSGQVWKRSAWGIATLAAAGWIWRGTRARTPAGGDTALVKSSRDTKGT
jgi:hypothetical protein